MYSYYKLDYMHHSHLYYRVIVTVILSIKDMQPNV